jgi:hypothetical protein
MTLRGKFRLKITEIIKFHFNLMLTVAAKMA